MQIHPEWEISVQDVRQMQRAAQPHVLIDVREPDEYRTCRIEGATLIPLSELERRIEEVRELAGDKPVVCHCHHGGRSLKAASLLRAAGINGVKSMAGGIDAWSLQIDPSVARY